MNYYSEWDPYAASWLQNLIDAGLIPPGHVDTRSITDVQPSDLAGYRQCHFFAGIGGWSLAARLAGWPDDRELWTGSAPCQPFSVAGKGKAQADDRHLWPHLFRLASACRPAVVMGEQVAAAVGKDWIDGVLADLEGIGYACGAAVVPACAVDAPHRRDRLWFVAHAEHGGREGWHPAGRESWPGSAVSSGKGDLAYAHSIASRQGCAFDRGSNQGGRAQPRAGSGCGGSSGSDVADGNGNGRAPGNVPPQAAGHGRATEPSRSAGSWDQAGWIIGHDGKARRVEPRIRLLAHGVPARVGRLRAYGNAIVPQVAAEVIGAYMDCYPQQETPR